MREDPKIIIFIKGLDLGGYSGGADLFGANLACALHNQGKQIRLCICFKFNSEAERQALLKVNEQGVTPHYLLDGDGQHGLAAYLEVWRNLSEYTQAGDIDIIHSHFQVGTFLSILLKFTRKVKRVVRTAHVDQEWRRGWNGILKQAVIRALIFVIFPLFVDLEVGVSTYAAELLDRRIIARLLRKRTKMIPNAIPTRQVAGQPGQQTRYRGWLGEHPVIGSVGRLEEQKGYDYLLEALPAVLSVIPDVETWLIGDGPLRDELKKHCQRLKITDHVVFWGKQDDVPGLLSKMDLFVSSSLYEGLPTAVLEAMDMGLPCVVTDIPGTRDVITGKNGVLVRVKDRKALADGIILVLGTPTIRKRLIDNAAQTIGRFRIANIAQEYMAAYQKL